MKKITFIFALFCITGFISAQQVITIYDGIPPGSEEWNWKEVATEVKTDEGVVDVIYNVVTPTLTAYLPSKLCNTRAAMVVCPGGGLGSLCINYEGYDVARWLANRGIAAFVLKYRIYYSDYPGSKATPKNFEENRKKQGDIPQLAADDGRKAIEYLRTHAEKLGIDPDKIGIMGFSAGNIPALGATMQHTDINKPNLLATIYGSRVGQSIPPADAPPLFLAAATEDKIGDDMPIALERWKKAGVPVEMHTFAKHAHGFGFKNNGDNVNIWMELLYNFMVNVGFIE